MRLNKIGALAVGAAVGVALASGCGTDTPADTDRQAGDADDADALPIVTEGDEVMVSCGDRSAGWPPAVMAEGVPGLLDKAEATRTFQSILNDPQYGVEAQLSILRDGVHVDWRVLRGDSRALTLGLGTWTDRGPAHDAHVLDLELEGNRWVPAGWGDCNLAPLLLEGNAWAQVDGYLKARPDARTLHATVTEIDCTSGRDPGPFLHDPIVVEKPDTVTIYWTTTPVEDDATCPGNPPITRAIELDAPLGDRQVLDGFTVSPQPVQPD